MSSFGSEPGALDRSGQQDVLPASLYLQARLQERRQRNSRPKRVRQSDFGPRQGRDDDIFLAAAEESHPTRLYDSSPLAAMSARGSDAGHSSTSNRRRTLGVRDMDDQLDRLTKENFALKLEIDHRRDLMQKQQEQLDAMRERIERAEDLENEHAELMQINSQLVVELEKRDKAVEEAMDIICDLEEQVSELVERNSNTRPSTAQADSGYAGTEMLEHDSPSSRPGVNTLPKSPLINVRQPSLPASVASQKLQGLLNSQTPARPRREPNILSEQKPSTHALRSVYMANASQLHPVKSFQSLISRQESRMDEELDDALNSPRLSVLSESSFPSIYSPKEHSTPDQHTWEDAIDEDGDASLQPHSHLRQDSIKRVSQWISERDTADMTPSKSNHISSPLRLKMEQDMPPPPPFPRHAAPDGLYRSLNDALSSAASRSPERLRDLKQSKASQPLAAQRQKGQSRRPRPISLIGPIPGEPLLPPTPDSVSTRMLRASRSSIVDDRSLLDTMPAVVKGFNALEPSVRTAPRQMRSSVELSGAYNSNMEHRQIDSLGLGIDESSDDDDFGEADRLSETVRDFGFEYDGFPDGKSIKMGTPSRFLKHPKPPAMFNLNDISPPQDGISLPTRRRSSDNVNSSLTKPRMIRVETSPTLLGTLGRMVSGGGKSSTDSVISPRSTHSGSSGAQTIVQTIGEQQSRGISPEAARARQQCSPNVTSPSRSGTSPSASSVRTFGQKTQSLFRRMSNSQGGEREAREKSPLPTLTQSPASVYADSPPIEIRRPMTSNTDRSSRAAVATPAAPRAPSIRAHERPPMQTRTMTEPNNARPSSASGTERERRNIFKRSNSLKKPVPEPVTAADTRRRGSIRDAVSTARRPWR